MARHCCAAGRTCFAPAAQPWTTRAVCTNRPRAPVVTEGASRWFTTANTLKDACPAQLRGPSRNSSCGGPAWPLQRDTHDLIVDALPRVETPHKIQVPWCVQ
jgi:hypothetical protein